MVDLAGGDAAAKFVAVQKEIRAGPFFVGDSQARGRTIEVQEPPSVDGVGRYTDRYLHKRTVGNTAKTYPFAVEFFPAELQAAIGATAKKGKMSAPEGDGEKLVDLEVAADRAEKEEQDSQDEDGEREKEASEPEEEDEFEDLEDDDYNAEKYFDDGDDFNDGDEDGDEAAY